MSDDDTPVVAPKHRNAPNAPPDRTSTGDPFIDAVMDYARHVWKAGNAMGREDPKAAAAADRRALAAFGRIVEERQR